MAEKGKPGVRLNPRHTEMVKAKIRASVHLTRLDKYTRGEEEMTEKQIDVAKYLINQAIGAPPKAVLHGVDPDAPTDSVHEIKFVAVVPSGGG